MSDNPSADTDKIAAEMQAAAERVIPAKWDGRFAANFEIMPDLTWGTMKYPVCYLPSVNGYPEIGKGLIAETYSEEVQAYIAAADPANVLAILNEREAFINELASIEVALVAAGQYQLTGDDRKRADRIAGLADDALRLHREKCVLIDEWEALIREGKTDDQA